MIRNVQFKAFAHSFPLRTIFGKIKNHEKQSTNQNSKHLFGLL